MTYKITFFLLLQTALCQAQGPKFAAYQEKVLEGYCECMQSNPTLPAITILYTQTDTCLRKIVFNNIDELLNVSDEFTFDEKMGDYERGRYIGKLVLSDGIDDLVRNCPFYVATMKRYFKEEGAAKGLTPEKIDTALVEFKRIEPEMTTDKQRFMLFQIFGVVYYMKMDFQEALLYFEKANAIKSTTAIKGFIEMIKQYDLAIKK